LLFLFFLPCGALSLFQAFIPGILAPLNKSQKPRAISSITIGPKQAGIIIFSRSGKITIANWLITNSKEENIPQAANALGIYPDLNSK
jgi:hypothetical protein